MSADAASKRQRTESIASNLFVNESQLVIMTCSPKTAPLAAALTEALAISQVCPAAVYNSGTADDLRNILASTPTRMFVFVGHTDLQYQPGEFTLGFCDSEGAIVLQPPQPIARLFAAHSRLGGGILDLVALSGCHSAGLGRMIREAGVPYVLCWKTKVMDCAAQLFMTTFFRSANQRLRVADVQTSIEFAFKEAILALTFKTRKGTTAGGLESQVPFYAISDPDVGMHPDAPFNPKPFAAGIPLLLMHEKELNADEILASS